MPKFLAQINIARLKAPIDHPSIAGFTDNLDKINAIAEHSPGFIWRLKDDASNNATAFNPYNDELVIINISVWKDMESLKGFVYHTEHVQFFMRRKEWFESMNEAHMAFWFVDEENMPDAIEGKKRLDHLHQHGSSDYAFDFKSYEQYV